jgi:hypothetical protein
MRRIRVFSIGAIMLAISSGGILAGPKQNPEIDFSKVAVVLPIETSMRDASASLLAETTQKNAISWLKKAALFSAVLLPEEAKAKDKVTLIEITGKLVDFMAVRGIFGLGPAHVVFDIAINDSATGHVLWKKRIEVDAPSLGSTAPQRSKLPETVAKEFVKQLCFSTRATPRKCSVGQVYFSGIGMIISNGPICKELSGVSGASGIGAGGEFWISKRFTLGGEIDGVWPIKSSCLRTKADDPDAVISLVTSYHFVRNFATKINVSNIKRIDPFLTIGTAALLEGERPSVSGQICVGGGINYWVAPSGGLRLEFRDYVFTFRDHMRTSK